MVTNATRGALASFKIIEKVEEKETQNDLKGKLESYFSKHSVALLASVLALVNKNKALEKSIPEPKEGKVAFLKSRYGKATKGFLDFHNIVDDESLREDKEPEGKSSREDFVIQGLEDIPDVSEMDLRDYLGKTYPESYIENSINSIKFFNHENEIHSSFQKSGSSEVAGFEYLLKDKVDERLPLHIFSVPGGLNKDAFFRIVGHEVHHPNDWNNSRVLTKADRVNMLMDFSARIKAPNRFMSPFVEGIDASQFESRFETEFYQDLSLDEVEKLVDYIKTLEYFPEVAHAFFVNGEDLKNNHPTDYMLVEKWINRINELNN